MTGKPGRSGGSRPGAGAPVQTVTLRQGDMWAVVTQPGVVATVVILNKNTVVLQMDDGSAIKLTR